MHATSRLAREPAAASASAAAAGARLRLPEVEPRKCTGCGRCVAACGPHLLSLEVSHYRKKAVLQMDEMGTCTGCSRCAVVCPFSAIRMRPAPP
jgi:ferredoxin